MKLYLNLLSIFLGVFAIAGLAMAEIPTKEVTETEGIEAIWKTSAAPSGGNGGSNKTGLTRIRIHQSLFSPHPGAAQAQTEQRLSEDEIVDREQNTSDTDIIETDESTETTSSEESTDNTVFIQCPVAELVTYSRTNLQTSDEELVIDSDVNLEVSYEELVTDSEVTNSEIIETTSPYIATTAEELLTESTSITGADIKEAEPEEVSTESSSAAETKIEEAEQSEYTIDCLIPEEYAHYQKLLLADNLYKAGEKLTAARIYQEEKEAWDRELDPSKTLPEANYEPTKLSPEGSVYWRIYQEGKQKEL